MENKTVYHFTSLDAFYNIIKSGSLYMFDIIKSNDPKEGKFALESLDIALNRLQYRNKTGLNDKQWVKFRKAFLGLAGDFKYPNPDYWMFCTSFCEIEKENLIPLWQIYGDQGRGVAIGFDKEKLQKLSNGIKIEPIEYLSNEDMEQFALDFIKKNRDKDEDELSEAMKEFYINSFQYKREYFEFEHEIRLSAKSMNLSDNMFCFEREDENLDFLFNHNRVKSYYKLNITKQNFDSIYEVFLGPACSMSTKEMRILLNRYCNRRVNIRQIESLINNK